MENIILHISCNKTYAPCVFAGSGLDIAELGQRDLCAFPHLCYSVVLHFIVAIDSLICVGFS